jgi:hypothetical protein
MPEWAEVENAQALAGQRTLAELSKSAVVRPTMMLHLSHRLEGEYVFGWQPVTIETVNACNAAHWLLALDQRTSDRGGRSVRHQYQVCSQGERHVGAHSVHEHWRSLTQTVAP